MTAPRTLRYQGQLYVRAQLDSPAAWFADLVTACRGKPFKPVGNERKAVIGQFGGAAVHVALLEDFVVVDMAFGRVYHMWQNRTHVAEDGMVEASGGWSAEMGDLYIVPAWRGRGAARAMVDAAENYLRARGAWGYQVTVTPFGESSHGLRRFYQKLGFAEEGRSILYRKLA